MLMVFSVSCEFHDEEEQEEDVEEHEEKEDEEVKVSAAVWS